MKLTGRKWYRKYYICACNFFSVVLFKRYSDIEIIEGIRKQDDRILNWVYDNWYGLVKDHVYKNSGDEDDASDVLQDSVIILFEQIQEGSLTLTTDLKGYFFGVARNVWNGHLRRKQKTTELVTDHPDDDGTDESNRLLLEKLVARAFEKLRPDQQQVLRLFSEGVSFEDIASIMNLSGEEYARRKKYMSKEALLDLVKEDPEYQEYQRLLP
ncbi:MAG TPA: sigma-70 family RNA polymerase sigma factor [Bacteroidales bacterium]|nr:sigma-70 family RNA polymerase sigma factor [Bacteroidales bacterium]